MSIDRLSFSLGQNAGRLKASTPSHSWQPIQAQAQALRKSLGEPRPQVVDISNNILLQSLFGACGPLERARKKLVLLSRKKGRIVPARGTTASALKGSEHGEEGTDNENLVFVGVEFAQKYQGEEETLAGVLSHEWGHLVSDFPDHLTDEELLALTPQDIQALRREEEAQADSFAGKMLFLMNHSPQGLIRFLRRPENQKPSLTYDPVETRVAIIGESYQQAKSKSESAKRLSLFPGLISTHLIALA